MFLAVAGLVILIVLLVAGIGAAMERRHRKAVERRHRRFAVYAMLGVALTVAALVVGHQFIG